MYNYSICIQLTFWCEGTKRVCTGEVKVSNYYKSQALKLREEIFKFRVENKRPAICGIFRNASVEEMNRVADEGVCVYICVCVSVSLSLCLFVYGCMFMLCVCSAGLDYIQLHGSEGYDITSQLNRPAFRVIHIAPGVTAQDVLSQLQTGI